MYETVVKAQKHLSEQKIVVVAESVGFNESFFDSEIKSELDEGSEEDVIIKEKQLSSKPKKKVTAKVPAVRKDKTTEDEEDAKISQFFSITCKDCPDLKFPKFGLYKCHMRSQHGQSWSYVTCCNTKFDKRHRLLEHISYHQDPDKFKCPECGRQFTSNEKIQNHQRTMHRPKDQLKHECDKCGKRFLKSCTLKTHMVVHLTKEEKDAKCNLICDECGNGFMSKYKLERHMEQVHLNLHLFVCDICAKVYKTKSQYRYHYTTAHPSEPQPKVQCKLCEKFFLNELCLKDHVKGMHSERGTHVCNICGKISQTLRAMRSHKRYMHEYTRKYVCTICNKAFKVADGLKEHMTVHLGGTLYGCQFCERTFNSKANMYTHRKATHPEELEKLKEEKQRGSVTKGQ